MKFKKQREIIKYVVWSYAKYTEYTTLKAAQEFIKTKNLKIEDYILEKQTTIIERLEG